MTDVRSPVSARPGPSSASLWAAVETRLALTTAASARADEGGRPLPIERLCWGASQGCPGVIIDAFGPLIVLTVYAPQPPEAVALWEAALREALSARPWILKLRIQGEDGYRLLRAEGVTDATRFEAEEDGLRYEIGCEVRHDFGLFPDARAARQAVRQEAAGRTVLNLFSYTCGFGLAALQGGAAGVCNVDASRDYLAWGKRNALLNGMDFRVIPETAQAFLRRSLRRKAARGQGEFDFIVADPPAFGVGRDNDRLLRLFWPEMAELLVALAPERMLLLFNDKYFREKKAAWDFVQAKFGGGYTAEAISAQPSGHEQGQANGDPFYLPPHTVLLRKRSED